jgi:hypothetical protein
MVACRLTMSRHDSLTYKPTNIIVLNRLVPQLSSAISPPSAKLLPMAQNRQLCQSQEEMEVKFTMGLEAAMASK